MIMCLPTYCFFFSKVLRRVRHKVEQNKTYVMLYGEVSQDTKD